MKKFTLYTLIIFFTVIHHVSEVYGQPLSSIAIPKKFDSSLQYYKNERTGAFVIYTRPDRSFSKTDIQMIAKCVTQDSLNSYRFRIIKFSKDKEIEADKIFIESSSGIYTFDRINTSDPASSRIIDGFINWGTCNQYGSVVEGYICTFILETSRENFIEIISSDKIMVMFSTLHNPINYITDLDLYKMHDLSKFLRSSKNIRLINLWSFRLLKLFPGPEVT